MSTVALPGITLWRLARRSTALLLAPLLLAGSCPTQSGSTPTPAPKISSLETRFGSSSGPSGALVRVFGSDLEGGTVSFAGTNVRTQGTGNPLLFTVPYTAAAGPHEVRVTTGGGTSSAATFQVTVTFTPNVPTILGVDVGYYTLGPLGSQNHLEVVVFGNAFDTNCRVVWDGTEVAASFTPGVPPGSITGIFGHGATLAGMDPQFLDQSLAAILSTGAGNMPALGSVHTVAVKNLVTGATSSPVNVTVPSRRVLVEIDKLAGVDWPPVMTFKAGEHATFRRPYTRAGILLDLRYDQSSLPDPRAGTPAAGTPFSDADVLNFSNAAINATNAGSIRMNVPPGESYTHISLLTSVVPPQPGDVVAGRGLDLTTRHATAIFADAFKPPTIPAADPDTYLFVTLHELGHLLNLTHCEGNAVIAVDPSTGDFIVSTPGTSIMESGFARDPASWSFTFTSAASTHLGSHPLNEVATGAGRLAFNDPARLEGACTH